VCVWGVYVCIRYVCGMYVFMWYVHGGGGVVCMYMVCVEYVCGGYMCVYVLYVSVVLVL